MESMPYESTAGSALTPERDIYTVARLNNTARQVLEDGFPASVWVEGELSNFSRPSSGHWYFTLKDPQAQVRCAMFRGRNQGLRFIPENGSHVLLRAKVSLYEGRGDFQLIVDYMEEAGDGALRRAFEQLKQKLAAEGLFEPGRKRPLPALARCVGVVTSPTGAAIRDILSVVRRRFPAMPVIIYPVPVQGEGAAVQIAGAIRLASARNECDVLLVARGGGSLEDLWAFNEEVVARAIFDCAIPVVSGVGHEIDFTIADFVADVRAPTPTAAAELVTPDQQEWRIRLTRFEQRLRLRLRETLAQKRQGLQWLDKRLTQQHPQVRLRQHAQRLDELEQRLLRGHKNLLSHWRARLVAFAAQIYRHSPDRILGHLRAEQIFLRRRLETALLNLLERKRQSLASAGRALETVSPLATLARGYAVVTRVQDAHVVTDAAEVFPGDRVQARLARGQIICRVEATEPPTTDSNS